MTTNGSTDQVVLRAAVSADLKQVIALIEGCHLPADDIAGLLGEGFVVAVHDSVIVGVAGVEWFGSDGLLRSIAVAPPWRSRTVGRKLVVDRIEYARTNQVHALFLLTTDAAAYFKRFGFTTIDRADVDSPITQSLEYSTLCPDTATVMVLKPA
jgi:amino-acid N-acetyltransferase